ncbi:LLM class flavin-dependent oxidoreductase [Solibacillus sp. FSL W7-1324]|uniref:LLM class flavin-dependent oxidoreductase n=1 Tax=Solibacillus sp. FSL W7-1324 TaxID=2921701 RepID=UPI0030FA33D8
MGYHLSILDQAPVIEGASNALTLLRTVELAQLAEKLGYKRFWVSEHHHSHEVASSSPEVLVSYILAKTNKIRVGSGGVMLSHYSPYKVAENFNVLTNLAGNRVDLGVGKAPGGLPLATAALQYGVSESIDNDFNERLRLLKGFIENSLPEEDRFAKLEVTPTTEIAPEIILLGGSVSSAEYAGQLGFTYVFAQFINSDKQTLIDAIAAYKKHAPKGKFGVAFAVIAAKDEASAHTYAEGHEIYKVHLASGRTLTLTTKEAAEDYGKQSGEAFEVKRYEANILSGTPSKIKETFDHYYELGVTEFILHTPIKNHEARRMSYELLSPKKLLSAVTV